MTLPNLAATKKRSEPTEEAAFFGSWLAANNWSRLADYNNGSWFRTANNNGSWLWADNNWLRLRTADWLRFCADNNWLRFRTANWLRFRTANWLWLDAANGNWAAWLAAFVENRRALATAGKKARLCVFSSNDESHCGGNKR